VSVAHQESSFSSSRQTEPPQYSIVVPAYNESARIGATLEQILKHVQTRQWKAEVVVVDDGSRDDTLAIAGSFAAAHPAVRILQNPGNQGKGYAVRNGMLQARGKILLFTDADLSSPISEAGKLFAALSLKRQVLSRLYNLFLRMVLLFPYRDTQCGFKAFSRAAAEKIFPLQRITRWGFDSEVLYLAHRLRLKVAEVPVAWGHEEGSQLHVWRDGARMAWDTLKIRGYALSGRYNL